MTHHVYKSLTLFLPFLMFHLNQNCLHVSARYGGFSLGARSSQALPPPDEIADAISHLKKHFSLGKVRTTSVLRYCPLCLENLGLKRYISSILS